MKRIRVAQGLAAVAVVMALVSWYGKRPELTAKQEIHAAAEGYARVFREQASNMVYFTDPDTSCQYLITMAGGITPRLHSDGVQVCMGEDKLGAQLPDYHEGEHP